MKQFAITSVLATSALFVGLSTSSFAGEPMPYVEPAPSHDHNGCVNPGFSLYGELLYFKSQGEGYEGDWDAAFRAAARYQMPDGLFFEIRGFYYESDLDDLAIFEDSRLNPDGDLTQWYLDFLIGDNIHNGDKFCVDFSAGVRYAHSEIDPDDYDSLESDSVGPILRLEGKRELSGPWSLYFDFTAGVLFGDTDDNDLDIDTGGDSVSFMTEIGGGIQYGFGNGYIRAGGEGQYWTANGNDLGLYGFTARLGWNF